MINWSRWIRLITAGNEDKYSYKLSEGKKVEVWYTDEKGISERTTEYRKTGFYKTVNFLERGIL